LRTTAYKCPAGVYTIGYGHTKGVKKGQKITKEQAV
jgi:lysozyme